MDCKSIYGGLNTDREYGTYCCLKLRTNIIGHSNISKALGKETEISTIDSAIINLKEILSELEIERNCLNK